MAGLTGQSVCGHLRLRCEVRGDGVPFLAEQDFRAPVHLSKAHVSDDGAALVVTVVNPTAGFFDGDELAMDVAVVRPLYQAIKDFNGDGPEGKNEDRAESAGS